MVLLVGCSQGLSDTDEQFRDLWRDQDHASYTYRYVVSGMGGEDSVGVTVVDDEVVETRVDDDDDPVLRSIADEAPTIDELFERIGELRSDVGDVAVIYDEEIGIPLVVAADDPDVTDDEFTIRIEGFTPTD